MDKINMQEIQDWLRGLGIDYTLDNLKNLKYLCLHSNQLQSLPASISKLKNLKHPISEICILQINNVVETKNVTDMYLPILELL